MTCTRFEDRRFDEDVRLALRGESGKPADLVEHLGECAECAAAWREAALELQLFEEALRLPAPPRLSADLQSAGAASDAALSRRRSRLARIGALEGHALSWGLSGGALAAAVVAALTPAAPPWQWAAFALGAALAASLVVLQASPGAVRLMLVPERR